MSKGVKLMAAACLLAATGWAQTPRDSLLNTDDNADVTFSESQLGDEEDAAQTASTISNLRNDPFLSEVGYRFSPMRFRIRAYDNQYNQYYMNGLLLNDAESGRFSYGLVGGMNDATRNRDGVSPYDYNTFGLTDVGGASNTNTRASMFMPGHKLTLSGTNRNYVLRGMYTFATGMSPSGWAFAGSVGYRWAKEGVIEGTFYNSFSYFLSVEKRFNDSHSLSLVTFGSPTERGQQGASTEEAYWLANSHYYNPNWGYQNGKKRNARVVKSFEPTTLLTWDWKIDHVTKLVTTFGFRYSNYGSTALGWNGDAYDPRPDYYKNLPSSAFNVYGTDNSPKWLSDNPFALEQWQSLYDYWTASKANRQINWDRLYYVNRQAAALGQETLYYQERRHNDQLVFALSPTFSKILDPYNKFALGLVLNHTKGMHYKTMEDLLGGQVFTDVDKFAANDYGLNSQEAQNDLNRPNRQIREGDVFGYDYNIFVNHAKLWGIFENNSIRNLHIVAGAHIDGTTIEREGLMRNGRAAENSYGKSGAAKFLGGGGKLQLAYRITSNHIFTLGGSYSARAPLARNAFVAPRIQNNFVDHLTTENIFSGEAAYQFNLGHVSGKLTGYYTRMTNMVEQTAFYNDQEARFTYLTMNDIDKEYYGFEGALKWEVNSHLSFTALASIGEAKYINNPRAQVDYEGMDAATIAKLNTWTNPVTGENMQLRVFAKDMHVSSTPLTALSLGVNYNLKGWFLGANLNYYNRVYVGFSQYRRLSNVLQAETIQRDQDGNYSMAITAEELQDLIERGALFYDKDDGHVAYSYIPKQEKFDGGFMLDLSIGKYIRLKRGRSISINLSLNNVTNNRNLRTGGYEMNRDDYYNNSQHTQRAYSFSNNSKYYYANAFNAFLNIGYRF